MARSTALTGKPLERGAVHRGVIFGMVGCARYSKIMPGGSKAMASGDVLQCDVEQAANDEQGNRVTIVKLHGKLVSDTSGELKNVVKPLIAQGGRIILDLGDVSHLDSSGLGALVGLKASAINHGYCMLELENMTPRILELLRITNLTQMFAK